MAIKIIVLAVGLVAMVPEYGKGRVHLLLLDTLGAQTSWGEPYAEHEGLISLTKDEIELKGEMYTLALAGNLKSASAPPRLAHVNELYGLREDDQGFLVKEACFNKGFRRNCVDAKRNSVVRSVVTLKGEWRVEAIDVKLTQEASPTRDVVDNSIFNFIALGESGLKYGSVEKALGGAIMFVGETDNYQKLIDGIEPGVMEDQIIECAEFFDGEPGKCIFVRIRNRMIALDDGEEDGHGHIGLPTLEVDKHFDRFYDLLSKPPDIRYLPVLSWLDLKSWTELGGGEGSGGGPEGLRCPGLVLKAP